MTEPPVRPEARDPRPLVVHLVVDTAVVFLATAVAAVFFGAEWWVVLAISAGVGAVAAPYTRRAEARALAARRRTE